MQALSAPVPRTNARASGLRRAPRIIRAVVLATLLGSTAAIGLAQAAPVQAIDDSARVVRLAQPARRIVTLAPHAAELVFEVGAIEQLVGVSAFSDFPPQAKGLPVVGNAHGLDLERILALKPDLVIAWTSGNRTSEIEALERAGLTVYRSDPDSLDEIATSLERLGILTGHPRQGATQAEHFRQKLFQLEKTYSEKRPVRVFYQAWDMPLMTIGGSQLISSVIRLCGGRNIFADLRAPSPMVSKEAVIAADPEVIVVASDAGQNAEELSIWKDWPRMTAVKRGQFVVLDPATITRATKRILIGAQSLCEALASARS